MKLFRAGSIGNHALKASTIFPLGLSGEYQMKSPAARARPPHPLANSTRWRKLATQRPGSAPRLFIQLGRGNTLEREPLIVNLPARRLGAEFDSDPCRPLQRRRRVVQLWARIHPARYGPASPRSKEPARPISALDAGLVNLGFGWLSEAPLTARDGRCGMALSLENAFCSSAIKDGDWRRLESEK